MSIEHTAEQLEAARAANALVAAVRIIRRHLRATGRIPTLCEAVSITRLYWQDPVAAIALIRLWHPTSP